MKNFFLIPLYFLLFYSCTSNTTGSETNQKEYYENGNIKSEIIVDTLVNSKRSIKYYENGKIKSNVIFVNDLREGKASYYDTLGNIKEEETCLHDTLNGSVIAYYPDGKINRFSIYVKGKEKSMAYYDEKQRTINALPFVNIRAMKDTVKLGEVYRAKITVNVPPFYDGATANIGIVKKIVYENGKRVEYCANLEMNCNSAFYSVKAERLGKNTYLGGASFRLYDSIKKDSIVYNYGFDFESSYFVIE